MAVIILVNMVLVLKPALKSDWFVGISLCLSKWSVRHLWKYWKITGKLLVGLNCVRDSTRQRDCDSSNTVVLHWTLSRPLVSVSVEKCRFCAKIEFDISQWPNFKIVACYRTLLLHFSRVKLTATVDFSKYLTSKLLISAPLSILNDLLSFQFRLLQTTLSLHFLVSWTFICKLCFWLQWLHSFPNLLSVDTLFTIFNLFGLLFLHNANTSLIVEFLHLDFAGFYNSVVFCCFVQINVAIS